MPRPAFAQDDQDVAADAVSESRYLEIVAQSGERIGYAVREERSGPNGTELHETSQLLLREDMAEAPTRLNSQTVYRYDAAGRVTSITDNRRTRQSWARVDIEIAGNEARLSRWTRNDVFEETVQLPVGTRFDAGAGLLADWNISSTPFLEFTNFNVSAMTVERVVIEPAADQTGMESGRLVLLRKRYEGEELRGIARMTLDAERNVIELFQPMFGTGAFIRPVDEETALRRHPPYRVLSRSLVRSPFRISDSARRGRIRYQARFAQGIDFDIPETGEQRVTNTPGHATIDICLDCGPGLPDDSATLARGLRSTAWLQSDHPRLQNLARPIAERDISDRRKVEMLLRRAQSFLGEVDFVGHFSALEMLSRRSGDCTEAAVLLTALARAAGIPAFVANGLVYSRASYHGVSNTFMPHSWTIAYVDGEWVSFDLALDEFDSTHIALTIGDGDVRSIQAASQLASLIEWESMADIRRRPASQ